MDDKKDRYHVFSFNTLSKNRDELYGISIVFIMLFHSYLCSVVFPVAKNIIGYGNMGCELFLALSGISMYFAYHKAPDLSSFITRRLVRLIIPTVTVCTVYWIYQLITQNITITMLLSNYTLTRFWITGDQQMWFVSLLLLAYIIYPYIHSILFDNNNKTVLNMLLLVFVWILLLILIMQLDSTFYNRTEIALTRLPIFIIGSALGKTVFYDDYPKIKKGTIFLLAAVTAIISFYILESCTMSLIVKRLFYAIPSLSMLLLFSLMFDLCKWELFHKTFQFFGKMSLELYLTHIIAIRLYKTSSYYIKGSLFRYLLLLLICIIFSYCINEINRWLLKLINKQISKNS